ncbi:MAG TPA: GNAT family N-acetyltransferase [Acidimicrobiales bacterium]|nr:GNAT family N-acetyltransferase [Acidimicrobiales bacterium]
MAPAVVDDPDGQRLLIARPDGDAELDYDRDGERFVVVHTEVPESARGEGLGGVLVRAAVERAAAEGLTVVPLCPYARRWLREHDDVASTVPIDWTWPGA